MLDNEEPISPMQSQTIKAAVSAIVINVLALVTIFTGKVFDIDAIRQGVETGVPLAVNLVSIWYSWRAIRGRITATKTIQQPK